MESQPIQSQLSLLEEKNTLPQEAVSKPKQAMGRLLHQLMLALSPEPKMEQTDLAMAEAGAGAPLPGRAWPVPESVTKTEQTDLAMAEAGAGAPLPGRAWSVPDSVTKTEPTTDLAMAEAGAGAPHPGRAWSFPEEASVRMRTSPGASEEDIVRYLMRMDQEVGTDSLQGWLALSASQQLQADFKNLATRLIGLFQNWKVGGASTASGEPQVDASQTLEKDEEEDDRVLLLQELNTLRGASGLQSHQVDAMRKCYSQLAQQRQPGAKRSML